MSWVSGQGMRLVDAMLCAGRHKGASLGPQHTACRQQ
jgi:hypothetical protein